MSTGSGLSFSRWSWRSAMTWGAVSFINQARATIAP